MRNEYSGATGKHVGLFAGLAVATIVAVTSIYGAVYGFGFMKQQVVGASKIMVAAMPVQTGPFYPPQGQSRAYYGSMQGGTAGQYVCPRDGAVGLPSFDQRGQPHCPVCSAVMQCICPPAAPQGGGGGLYNNAFIPAAWGGG